jgi:hypothetical protein
MSARLAARLLLPFAALLPAACLEVESMEVEVVADPAADRLDVMILSRGVSSSGSDEKTLAKDLADLRRCRDAAAIPIPGLGIVDFAAPAGDEDEKHLQSFLPLVDIEAGAFFVDEQGRLGFYQFARIRGLKEFCALVDARVHAAWQKERDKASAATRALQERAAAEKWPLLRIEGAAFVFARPLAAEDHRRERLEFWRDVVEAARSAAAGGGEEGKDGAPLRGELLLLAENDLAIVRREHVTEYVVGALGSSACSYRLPGKEYQDNLLKHLEQSEPRPPAVTQALIEKQFAAFHGRPARLPAEYRKLRERAAAGGK